MFLLGGVADGSSSSLCFSFSRLDGSSSSSSASSSRTPLTAASSSAQVPSGNGAAVGGGVDVDLEEDDPELREALRLSLETYKQVGRNAEA